MKRCPACDDIYSDDLSFCLTDGTPLTGWREEPEQQTVIRGPVVAQSRPVDQSSPLRYVVAVLSILLILITAGAVIGAWMLWPRNDSSSSNLPAQNGAVSPPNPASATNSVATSERDNLKEKEADLERERHRLADERTKLEDEKRRDSAPPEQESTRFDDPGTARIIFRRGAVSQMASGTVGRARQYVLRTMAGQYLSASIRSANGCVVFDGGSTNTEFTTGRGDTFLGINNNCSQPSNYSLSVTVR